MGYFLNAMKSYYIYQIMGRIKVSAIRMDKMFKRYTQYNDENSLCERENTVNMQEEYQDEKLANQCEQVEQDEQDEPDEKHAEDDDVNEDNALSNNEMLLRENEMTGKK
jgi:hypothetical protein